MPNRTITTFTAAIAFSLLAGSAIAAPEGAAAVPEQTAATNATPECHAAPKGVAPQGSHWYFRTDRATKRKCWYLADQVTKASKAAAAKPSPSAESDSQQAAEPAIRRSVSDARAELSAPASMPKSSPTPQPSAEDQTLAESVWPPMPESSAEAASDAQPSAPNDNPLTFASRWSGAGTSTDRQATATPAITQDVNRQAAANSGNPPPPPAVAAPAPAIAPSEAVMPSSESSSEPAMPLLGIVLSVLAGLLALAAVLGPKIFKYVRPRPKTTEQRPRRAIWDTVDDDRLSSEFSRATEATRNDNVARQPHNPTDLDSASKNPDDEIEKLLQRASKRSAA